jgi:hypothetical protein
VLRKRRSAADAIRGVRNGAALYLTYGADGLLELNAESSLAIQQSDKPACSNSKEMLNGGWPAYEFGDAGSGFSDIARRSNGEPSLRLFSRSTADTPNRYAVEFQDEFNGYQQDSLSLVDVDDALLAGQEISASITALGLPNFNQAGRVLRLQLDKSIRGNTYVEFETGVRGIGLKPGDLITITYVKEGFQRQAFRVIRMAPGLNYRSILLTAQIHNDEWYVGGDGELGVIGGGRQPAIEAGVPKPLIGTIVDDEGFSQFEVEETPIETADGSYEVSLAVKFGVPARPSKSAPAIPLMSLAPRVIDDGGALVGGRSYYYAVSAVGSNAEESALSFVGRASVAAGITSGSVVLHDLSFAPDTTVFHVYRGTSPAHLMRIAKDEAVAAEWTDTGAEEELSGPPDANYHHANFYWRLELAPEVTAATHSATTAGNEALRMLPDEYRGKLVCITAGLGRGQERSITSNSDTIVTVSTAWEIEPDSTSKFVIVEPAWNFAALAETSPIVFRVPNREGATIHVSGRAANVHDRECAYELSPLTRWTIGGASADVDVPPIPVFGLNSAGQGMCEITGIGFETLEGTRSISGGSLTLHYRNELSEAPSLVLADAVDEESEEFRLSSMTELPIGSVLQVGSELVAINEILEDGMGLVVQRGALGSVPTSHPASDEMWDLDRKRFVLPFVRGIFGTPAGGSYSHVLAVPDIRIVGAELYVTNVKGNSQVGTNCYARLVDGGIRTLSGGQYSMQIDGVLSVQSDAVPAVSVEASHAIRDVFAHLMEPATGSDVEVVLTSDGEEFAALHIPAGETLSDPVLDGLKLPALQAGTNLGISVVGIGSDRPGAGLTVTIRL